MFSWVKRKFRRQGAEFFPQLSVDTRNRLNDACRLVYQLFPSDEGSAERIIEILDTEHMSDYDFSKYIQRIWIQACYMLYSVPAKKQTRYTRYRIYIYFFISNAQMCYIQMN